MPDSAPPPVDPPHRARRAVVIGAGGGIGSALVARLVADGWGMIHALSRDPQPHRSPAVRPSRIDVAEPGSIAAAAAAIDTPLDTPLDLVIVATGLLHEITDGVSHRPERALRELDADWLERNFRINAIGPALVLRHFAPLLARDTRATIACLSARVGSITDNRAGGWYGYRASKAALNQIVRTAAIEIARTRPQAVCVTLHPGTVDTGLSAPFQARVPEDRLFTPAFAAERLLAVLEGLTPAQSGRCFAWDGAPIAP